MIDVKGLKKNYGGLQVLKGVDLTINKGDCVVLVGPSGCGKSTFLRCLNRLEEPDGGHVIFNGKEVTDHDIDHVRQKMGMVFQHFNLFPHLTVKKNITLAPVKLGLMKQAEADAKAMELLGVTPQECIFFDDSVKSCRSAKASGMTVIGVYDPFFEGTKDEMPLVCDRFIRDFGEML